MEIPIKNVKSFAGANGLTQVIVFGYDGSTSHIATWAEDAGASDAIATAANVLKASLGWPEITQVESAKVLQLRQEIQELKSKLLKPEAGETIEGFALECVEHEQGWGSRPDGYLVFKNKKDQLDFLNNDYREKNSNSYAPSYYVNYRDLGAVNCHKNFFSRMKPSAKYTHVDALAELKINHCK